MNPVLPPEGWEFLVALPVGMFAIFFDRIRELGLMPGVLIAFATLEALGIAALSLPASSQLLLIGLFALGTGLVAVEIIVVYRHEARRKAEVEHVRHRLNVLDRLADAQRTALVRRLFQVQTDVSGLTREYHIHRIPFENTRQTNYDEAIHELAELVKLEKAATLKYMQDLDNEVRFVLYERQYGFETDEKLDVILATGINKVEELDCLARGLHRMIELVNRV
jgi:hypothetical protein